MKFYFPFLRKKPALETAARANLGLPNRGNIFRSEVATKEHAEALRQYHEFNGKQIRMYDAAITTNLNPDFIPTVTSANADVKTSLYVTRGRCRTLVRDYPPAQGLLTAIGNNVCGDDPFRLKINVGSWSADGKKFTPDDEINRKIKAWWKDVKRPKNLTTRGDMGYVEMCQMVAKSAFRDGSIIAKEHFDFPHNKYNYALEFIESDRLQEIYCGTEPETGNVIRSSIERDKWNRPVAYWILNRHPGDLDFYNGWSPEIWRERIPAENIIHFNNMRSRAEQDVGFPEELASVAQSMHRIRQFTVAHTTAAIQSAIKPWWIKQEYPTGMQFAGDPSLSYNQVGADGLPVQVGQQNQIGDGKGGGADKVERFEPGAGVRTYPLGHSLEMIDPKFPMEAATQFRRDNMLDISSGTGMSYATVSSDVKEMSFSVARFSVLPERQGFKVRQSKMICDFVREHYEHAMENSILSGALDLPISRLQEFFDASEFKGVRWPYIQPVQDVQADGIAMELNLESPQEILEESENGRDIEEVIADIAAYRAMLVAHGLPLPEDATIPTIKKGEPGQQDNSAGQPANATPSKQTQSPSARNGRMRNVLNGHRD